MYNFTGTVPTGKTLSDLSGTEMDAERVWVKQGWRQIMTGKREERKVIDINIHPMYVWFTSVEQAATTSTPV